MTTGALIFLVATVLGGLALFLFGMKLMTQGLEAAAGNRLRALLDTLTRNRVAGLGVGTVLGTLVHSSAATVMLVGFINAGLVTLAASIPVLLGANLGTTLSMQLISFKLGKYAYMAIALGLGTHLAAPRTGLKDAGLMLFGFGLLFLGMNTMSDAIVPLKEAGIFEAFLARTGSSTATGMALGILAATLVTGVIQSSGATIGMLFALAHAGVFRDLAGPFPLLLGAHIGTCATALLGSLGTNLEARRSALAHLLFNVFGAIAAALMAPLYLKVLPLTSDDLARQIANAHTAVQTINAAIVLPLSVAYARFIVWITPSREPPEPRSFLEERYLATPEMAILAVILETRRMAAIARKMVRRAVRGLAKLTEEPFPQVLKDEASVDLLKETINQYLIQLSRRELSRRQAVIVQYLVRASSDIERMADHAEVLVQLTAEKTGRRVWFEDGAMERLIGVYRQADEVIGRMIESLDPARESFEGCACTVMEARGVYRSLSQAAREEATRRVLAQEDDALTGMVYEEYLNAFDRIVSHAKRVALVEQRPLFKLKPHKLERTSPERPKAVAHGASQALPVDTGLFRTDALDLYADSPEDVREDLKATATPPSEDD